MAASDLMSILICCPMQVCLDLVNIQLFDIYIYAIDSGKLSKTMGDPPA